MQDTGKVAAVIATTFFTGVVCGWLLNQYTRKVRVAKMACVQVPLVNCLGACAACSFQHMKRVLSLLWRSCCPAGALVRLRVCMQHAPRRRKRMPPPPFPPRARPDCPPCP